MGRKKRTSGNPKERHPPKPRYTSRANIYDHEVLAPLTKRFHQALKAKNYDDAQVIYKEITKARNLHRLWIHRCEQVRIR